MIFARLET